MPRDASGNYTLAAGNPVVAGTIIESAWANTTMQDIADALTDSLSRTGNGGMAVPFTAADGTEGVPAYSFTNGPTSGMWYDNANTEVGISVNANASVKFGTNISKFNSPSSSIYTLGRTVNTGIMALSGGVNSSDGGAVYCYGSNHPSDPYSVFISQGGYPFIRCDGDPGDISFHTGPRTVDNVVAGRINDLGQWVFYEGIQVDSYLKSSAVYNQVITGREVIVEAGPAYRFGTLASKREFKEDVESLKGAEKLYELNPVSFKFKDGDDKVQFGLIAEEVAEVYPDLADFNEDGSLHGVQYRMLSPLLLAEVQKLNHRVIELEQAVWPVI